MTYVDQIILSQMKHFEPLSNDEILCLTACCLLHDVGLAYEIRNTKDFAEDYAKNPLHTKERHAISSSNLIKMSAGLIDGGDILNIGIKQMYLNNMAKEIAWICEKHSGDISIDDMEKTVDLSSKEFRIGLLLCILRLADELDRTYERVTMSLLNFKNIPPESMLHWYLHHFTKSVLVEHGVIRITLRYPDLPAPAPSKIKALIIEKIKKEVDLVKLPLQKWGIAIQFDEEIKEDFKSTNLDSPSEDILKLLLNIDDSKVKVNTNISPTSENWMQYWGFNGNPWSDILLGADDDLLVKTNSIDTIISETVSIAKGPVGGVKLIVADRRGGKTTLYHVMHQILSQQNCKSYCIQTLNTGERIIDGVQLYDFVKRKAKEIALDIRGVKSESTDKNGFSSEFELTTDNNVVVFIDNLDRLKYDDVSEKKIIYDFFKAFQEFTDEVQSRWYVLICVPTDWMELLNQDTFRYLRPKLNCYLEAFNQDETNELISKRLQWIKKDADRIITTDAIEKICEISQGLPGMILQHAEWIFTNGAKEKKEQITGEFVERYYATELSSRRKHVALEIAATNKDLEKGLSLLYLYQRDIERYQSDVSQFFK